jgi:hypothetical protein
LGVATSFKLKGTGVQDVSNDGTKLVVLSEILADGSLGWYRGLGV